jgi:hypothetical protein
MSYKVTGYKIKPFTVKTARVTRPYVKNMSLWSRFSKWVWSWLRTPVIYTLFGIIFVSSVTSAWFGGELYRVYHPVDVVEAQMITNTVKVPYTPVPPVMSRIKKAETHGDQYCNADAIANKFCTSYQKGEVLETTNTDRSVDIGEYAINNKAFGAQAVQLGYDIYTADGNEAMAMWIYENVGTGPWYSSKSRWQ